MKVRRPKLIPFLAVGVGLTIKKMSAVGQPGMETLWEEYQSLRQRVFCPGGSSVGALIGF